MYRIRSASGTEANYSSLEEFSAAVRRGEVHAEDEIFHSRANRWLDVKSHPHYRTALAWHGHESNGAASAPVPRPAAAPGTPPSQTSSRVQVFERPVVPAAAQPQTQAPSHTVVRPQLQPEASTQSSPLTAPAADPPAPRRYGPPPKSKELTFLDLGTTPPKPAEPVKAEAPKPAVETPKAHPAKTTTVKLAPEPGTELDFLVMDNGIESPVRTSAGYKTLPEDLDLLFNAPMPEQRSKEPPSGRGVAAVGAPARAPETSRPAKVPAVPAAPAAPVAPVPAAATAEPIAPAAAAPAKPAAPATPAAPAQEPTPVAVTPPAPVAVAAPAPVVVTPAAPVPVPAPAPVAAPASKAVPAPAAPVTPVKRATVGRDAERDLEIPGGPLRETPAIATATPAAPRIIRPAARPPAPLLIGGVALVAVVGTLLAWRPWTASGAEKAPLPSQPAPAPVPIGSSPPSGRAPAATPLAGKPASTSKGTEAAGAKAADPGKTDSAGTDEVIAAKRPTFQANVSLPAAGLSLETETSGKSGGEAVPPSELVKRLAVAERQAQQELASKLNAAGFRAVLTPSRLSTSEGVSAARNAWSLGADAIRAYRGHIARLEQAYEDSVLSSQRTQRWSGAEIGAWASRQSVAEQGETSQLVDLMFSQVSEGLDILAALDGGYTIRGSTVSFKNAASATRYSSIRGWVDQRIGTWAATPESARPTTISAMLKGLGDGFPAVQ